MGAQVPENIQGPIRDRLEKVISLVKKNLAEEVSDLFVSSRPGETGPEYIAIWLFTENFMAEVRNPLRQAQLQHDVARLAGLVDWLRLTGRNYEFLEAEQNSELDLEFSTSDGLSGTLSATGTSCELLMDIYRRKFRDNLRSPTFSEGTQE